MVEGSRCIKSIRCLIGKQILDKVNETGDLWHLVIALTLELASDDVFHELVNV